MKVCLTIDLEPDCPPYLNTFRGIETGVNDLLDLFASAGIATTFFTTGTVARYYPEVVERVVAQGHELGSHGDTHRDFTRLDAAEAAAEIILASQTLRQFAPVIAFRAPYLKFPDAYLKFLEHAGYQIDSSQARYKLDYYRPAAPSTLKRIPASVTSSVLRLPDLIRRPYLERLTSPVVLFVHPWEFVDLRKEKLRFDCRFRTGPMALRCLQAVIHFFKRKEAEFLRISDIP